MENSQNFFSNVLKGALFAIIISLISILIFAFIIKLTYLNSGVIKAVNQFIKIISVFLACTFCLGNKAGLVGGALIGLLFTLVSYLLFALFLGQTNFGATFIIEIIFMIIIGSVSGIISVNLKK